MDINSPASVMLYLKRRCGSRVFSKRRILELIAWGNTYHEIAKYGVGICARASKVGLSAIELAIADETPTPDCESLPRCDRVA